MGAGLSHHAGLLDSGRKPYEHHHLQAHPLRGGKGRREDRHERLQHEQPLDPHLTGGRLDLHKTVRLLPRALYARGLQVWQILQVLIRKCLY